MEMPFFGFFIFTAILVFLLGVSGNPTSITEDEEILFTPQLLKIHIKAMQFLGTDDGGISYFIDRLNSSQFAADSVCRKLGLQLAEFDDNAQIEWVHNRINATDAYIWTSGIIRHSHSAFSWGHNSGNHLDTSVPLLGYENSMEDRLGLVYNRYWRSLVPKQRKTQYPFLCTKVA